MRPERVPSGNMPGSEKSMFASTPMTTYDFYPFAGIHRPVVLYTVPKTYIQNITVVTEIDGADGVVKVKVELNTEVDGNADGRSRRFPDH